MMWLAMLVVLTTVVSQMASAAGRHKCQGLVKYNVTFHALWSKENFPKQYPNFRPHAQWTKMIGRTHSSRYSMYSVGELSTPGVKQFSQLGVSVILDHDAQGADGILDLFHLPALKKAAVGDTSAKVFLDNRHSKVSMMARIVPSPDWFVGVDSFDLCSNSGWLDDHTVDLQPMDGGTDQGYTFTAPNWPEEPPKPISIITSSVPNHPANSFFYPELHELPVIGHLQFKRVSSYKLKETVEDESESAEDDSGEAEVNFRLDSVERTRVRPQRPSRPTPSRQSKQRQSRPKALNRYAAKDCTVTEWTAWSACSKTCGFGKRQRGRNVMRRRQGYGAPCPDLMEDELCGSMRNCGWKHFSKFSIFKSNRRP